MTAPILIVEQATDRPAEDAMAAGALAGFLKEAGVTEIGFVRLNSPDREFAQLGAREHATAYGALVANGMIWAERALGRDLGPDSDCTVAALQVERPSLLAVNPNVLPQSDRDALVGRAAAMRVQVSPRGVAFVLATEADGVRREIGALGRDGYGRPILDLRDPEGLLAHFHAGRPTARPANSALSAWGPVLVVVGEESYHRDVYPALLAALGDAADALGQTPAVRFVSPRNVAVRDWPNRLAQADGILLPGGPDTTQTAGQVDAAAATLDAGIATLGICLGMQTMTTAFARRRAGLPDAGLEEIDPHARPQVFVRMRSPDGEGRHRLGAKRLRLDADSRLAALLGVETATERLHHRYHLSPELVPVLAGAGLRLAARDCEERIVDAIEAPDHPFFMGLQCHIELSSRNRRAPHPVLTAFLDAARGASRRGSAIAPSAPRCSTTAEDVL